MEEKLDLELHQQKVFIRKFSQGVDFLGYVIFPHHTVIRTRTKKRLNSFASYLGVIKHANAFKVKQKLMALAREIN